MAHERLRFLRIQGQERNLVLVALGFIAIITVVMFWRLHYSRSSLATRGFLLKTDVDAEGKKYTGDSKLRLQQG